MKPIAAHYNGMQLVPNGESFELWTLLQPCGDHPTYSTLSRNTLAKLGFQPVDPDFLFNIRVTLPHQSFVDRRYIIIAESRHDAIRVARAYFAICNRTVRLSYGTLGNTVFFSLSLSEGEHAHPAPKTRGVRP